LFIKFKKNNGNNFLSALILILAAFVFSHCQPGKTCDTTSDKRSLLIRWDSLATYATRGCKGDPGANRANPLYAAQTAINSKSGLVYVQITLLDGCDFSDIWYSYYYWQQVGSFGDYILIPVNHKFKMVVEYSESCMHDCNASETNFPGGNNSAIFKSSLIINPAADWPSSGLDFPVPAYTDEDRPCRM